jgi:hypothetical protein
MDVTRFRPCQHPQVEGKYIAMYSIKGIFPGEKWLLQIKYIYKNSKYILAKNIDYSTSLFLHSHIQVYDTRGFVLYDLGHISKFCNHVRVVRFMKNEESELPYDVRELIVQFLGESEYCSAQVAHS